MSTLADELLNDFEDSESDGENGQQNGFLRDVAHGPTSNDSPNAMVVDGNEEDSEDEEMINGVTAGSDALEAAEDEDDAKAKVEKMQLGGVNDVRNVAGLMKTLEPVLEVGFFFMNSSVSLRSSRFTSPAKIALTLSSPPENSRISIITTRKTDYVCRFNRRKP